MSGPKAEGAGVKHQGERSVQLVILTSQILMNTIPHMPGYNILVGMHTHIF